MNTVLTATLKAVRMNTVSASWGFCNRQGTSYPSFQAACVWAVRKAGLEDFTLHDLRHTFAGRPGMAGMALPSVQDLIGHKNISMPLRYTHLSRDRKWCAVRALEQFGASP